MAGVQGQINLRDAVRRDCSFSDPKSGKRYQLGSKLATLLVRVQLHACAESCTSRLTSCDRHLGGTASVWANGAGVLNS